MWKVKYIDIKTKQPTWRCYRNMEEHQVRKIADNMKGLIWVAMVKEY